MSDFEMILFRLYTDHQFRKDVQADCRMYQSYDLSNVERSALADLDLDDLDALLRSPAALLETGCIRRA